MKVALDGLKCSMYAFVATKSSLLVQGKAARWPRISTSSMTGGGFWPKLLRNLAGERREFASSFHELGVPFLQIGNRNGLVVHRAANTRRQDELYLAVVVLFIVEQPG